MINVLYVGGKKINIPQLSGTDAHLDYVQNGMIALSAVQTCLLYTSQSPRDRQKKSMPSSA